MKIILMRHGKPVLAQSGRITPVEMERWIEHYNLAEVEANGAPPIDGLPWLNASTCIAASTAPRALSSVQALGHTPSVVDAVFCEAQLPFAVWRFPRLPPVVWAALFRLFWFFGYSRGSESIQVARARAKIAARKLVALAGQGPVLLVGHGIMNRLIAKELIALGWAGPAKHRNSYWDTSVYRFPT
ncbi:histidine phosphatase family protein [Candidatus Methylobacter oryzae]|uniref:Histidine phosphatase family protein n=2 Tax=Candidatus Methylobacter oryzae TaxID=2497749 RepID=A0ABY3C8Z3_9GAMM|nr:histidine phosphatase family protein [Candidatus Methylobacter oryzae]